MRRSKDVSKRFISLSYQLRRPDDLSAWSAMSRSIWDLIKTSLPRRMLAGKAFSKFMCCCCSTTHNYIRFLVHLLVHVYFFYGLRFFTGINWKVLFFNPFLYVFHSTTIFSHYLLFLLYYFFHLLFCLYLYIIHPTEVSGFLIFPLYSLNKLFAETNMSNMRVNQGLRNQNFECIWLSFH